MMSVKSLSGMRRNSTRLAFVQGSSPRDWRNYGSDDAADEVSRLPKAAVG
jgi:hypothetical protein